MLKSCGVIVEYNPFHSGHEYHLMEARKKSGADVIIAVMSGNFLQRGEPAIVDKWHRAQAALENGADLVIELPLAYSVQSADYFAGGAVSLLQALSVEHLCFGTDSSERLDYEGFAKFNIENEDVIQAAFQALKSEGLSYPQQMTKVYQTLYPEWPLSDKSPNHILGMSYAKANQNYQKPMMLHPIQRIGAAYHTETINRESHTSATAIRSKLKEGEEGEVATYLAKEMLNSLREQPLVDWQQAWPLLKYQLVNMSVSDLGDIYQMAEGIEYRIKEKALTAESFETFVDLVKNKRFTWTRLQRLSIYILLGIKEKDVKKVRENPYIRVLGFNKKGREFLGQAKESLDIPLITNVNQKNEELLSLDIKAGQIYQLLGDGIANQDYQRKPIII